MGKTVRDDSVDYIFFFLFKIKMKEKKKSNNKERAGIYLCILKWNEHFNLLFYP